MASNLITNIQFGLADYTSEIQKAKENLNQSETALNHLQQLNQQTINDFTMYNLELALRTKEIQYLDGLIQYLTYVRSKIHFDRMGLD